MTVPAAQPFIQQLIRAFGGDFSSTNPLQFSPESVASAGSSQGTATELTGGLHYVVTGADGTKAVRLPDAAAGLIVVVVNDVSNQLLPVYPATGDDIAGLSSNAATKLQGLQQCVFVAKDSTTWSATYDNPRWEDYTPTLTGGGSLTWNTSTNVVECKFHLQYPTLDISYYVASNTGGSASAGDGLNISLPHGLIIASHSNYNMALITGGHNGVGYARANTTNSTYVEHQMSPNVTFTTGVQYVVRGQIEIHVV